MSKILVFAESHQGEVKNVTYEILGRLQGQESHVVCLENPNDDSLGKLAQYGAASITVLKSESLETYSPEAYASAFKEHIAKDSYDYVFTGATSTGKDFFPRLSSSFDAGLASDIVDFTIETDQFKGVRPLFAGKCLADVEISGPKPHFISVRPNALGLTEMNASSDASVTVVDSANSSELKAKITEVIKGASEKLDLTEANIIVSGGRAMGNAENFKILDDMANILGISYEEINVWIFCVIWPILTLIMFAEILRLRLKINTKNENRYY